MLYHREINGNYTILRGNEIKLVVNVLVNVNKMAFK